MRYCDLLWSFKLQPNSAVTVFCTGPLCLLRRLPISAASITTRPKGHSSKVTTLRVTSPAAIGMASMGSPSHIASACSKPPFLPLSNHFLSEYAIFAHAADGGYWTMYIQQNYAGKQRRKVKGYKGRFEQLANRKYLVDPYWQAFNAVIDSAHPCASGKF